MSSPSVLTILFLAANPEANSQSNLEREARDIGDGLVRSKHRDRFKFEQRWAVRPRDIQLALLECNPQIVHFAGNRQQGKIIDNPGTILDSEVGLLFQDETGQTRPIHADALANLFKLFSDQVNCVLLNGCYTESQAKIITQYISHVIGMKRAITDEASLVFALGFYDALGVGRSIEFAYRSGCAAIRMAGLPEHLTPILYMNSESNFIFPPDDANRKTPSNLRVQEKCEDLEEEYQEIRKKLKWLKKEWTLKTDSESKYELSQRIEQYEVKLQDLEELLDQLKNNMGQ